MMKRIWTVASVCLIGLTTLLCVSAADEPVGLSIVYPSSTNATIAPGRDFYVIGRITGTIPEQSRMRVSVFRVGEEEPVRTVYTDCKDHQEGLFTADPGVVVPNGDRTVLTRSKMPDLVYDPAIPDSYYDAWRKCYYDDNNFSALISGGKFRTGVRLRDEQGVALVPLDAGDYYVEASLEKEGDTIAKVTRKIKFDSTADKVISGSGSGEHEEKVLEEAKKRGYTVYTDPMPGYWSPTFLTGMEKDPLFCEIPAEWKLADRAEYAQGLSHLYLYNIPDTCIAQTVELGLLQQQGVIDNRERLLCHYYSFGEPVLQYLPHRISTFQTFQQGERLVYTRSEISSLKRTENRYDPMETFYGMIDFVIEDGLDVRPGETVSLFGVVPPIQNRDFELAMQPDRSLNINNRIAWLRYEVSGDGIHTTLDKRIQLTRKLGGQESTSLYEFKHTFEIGSELAGRTLHLKVMGFDTQGRTVEGTNQQFDIRVQAEEQAVA